jgi:putative membrane protein
MRLLFTIGSVWTFVLANSALADSSEEFGHTHMMIGGYGHDGFGMYLGPVFILVFLAALVVGILAFIRWTAPGAGLSTTVENNALSALNLRFANGEIEAEEYAERKKLLLS